jgi:hypothetical protein
MRTIAMKTPGKLRVWPLLAFLATPALGQQVCPAGLPRTTPDVDFFDSGNGTVLHLPTGLMWKRCSEGTSWTGSACSPSIYAVPLGLTWQQALARADAVNSGTAGTQNAGYTDWRLPNVNELESIVERGCWRPSINMTQFEDTRVLYWASSPTRTSATNAYLVGFWFGGVGGLDLWDSRANSYLVRLVRGGSKGGAYDTLAPGAPTLVSAQPGNGTILIGFAAAGSGPAATTFTASCSTGNITRAVISTASPITVNRLTNATTYTCSVTAGNAEGSSLSSNAASVTPHGLPPGAATLLRLIPGDTSMKLMFAPPAENGGEAITGYTATCTPTGGGPSLRQDGATSPIVVNGLTHGISYTCSVHATNEAGSGNESTARSKVTRRTGNIVPLLPIVVE